MNYKLEREYWWRLDPDIRDSLMGKPAALKIFMACLFENMSAKEMYTNHKLQERYQLNRNSLRTHAAFVDVALHEYTYLVEGR